MFGRLKDWRRVATRYDRCPSFSLRRRPRSHCDVLAMKRERVLTLLYFASAKLIPSLTLARVSDGVVRDV
jgi:hypothetical protein